MKKTVYILVLIFILIGFWAGFYFHKDIMKIYSKIDKDIENLKQIDLGPVVNKIAGEIFTPPPLKVDGQATSVVLVKSKIIAQTNIQRFNNGMLPPLVENPKLTAAAMAKAEDMFKNQYFEHISPSGLQPGQLVKNFGYEYILSGENLILGNFENEAEVVQKWMDSPGHRANILNDRFTEIGVAIVKGNYDGQTVWIGVQEFGLPLSFCDLPSKSLENEVENKKAVLVSLSIEIEQKRKEIEKVNIRSSQYNNMVDEYNFLVVRYNELVDETKNLINQYNFQVNKFNSCAVGN